jgi:hypothetical protein
MLLTQSWAGAKLDVTTVPRRNGGVMGDTNTQWATGREAAERLRQQINERIRQQAYTREQADKSDQMRKRIEAAKPADEAVTAVTKLIESLPKTKQCYFIPIPHVNLYVRKL